MQVEELGMALGRRAALLGTMAALAGCSRFAPVYDARNVPFGGDAPEFQRAAQIRRAGASLGWTMADVQPGMVRGTLDVRTHSATVDIAYTRRAFSIFHASSQNLRYGGGEIHRGYNDWVRSLEQAIVAQAA